MTAESLDAELLKDLKGLGKLLSFDGNDCRVPRLSIQLQNTHEPRQFCFSRDEEVDSNDGVYVNFERPKFERRLLNQFS